MSKMSKKKNYMFRCDLARIFRSWRIYIAAFAGLLLMTRPVILELKYRAGYSPMQLLVNAVAGSDFTPFAVIFCVLPFAESFCEDLNSGYLNAVICRIGIRRYALKRCASVAVSGGIVASFIMLFTILLCVAAGALPDTEETIMPFMNSVWARMGIVLTANGAVMYILRVFTAFVFGAVWALVGLAVSVCMPNRYITLLAPFIIYQGLWYLLSEKAVNPVYLFRGDSNYIPSFGFLLGYQLFWIGVCAAISAIGMARRSKR